MTKKWLLTMCCMWLLACLATAQADLLSDWEAAVSAGDPLHWYKFDETEGLDCLDAGSGKLDGTYDSPVPGTAGFFGPTTAATFTRTGANRANFGGAENLPGPYTVEYVVMTTKPAAANDSQALHDSDTTSIRVAGWTSVGEAGFTLYGVADYRFTPEAGRTMEDLIIPANEWMNLTFRNDPSGTQLFFNGELVATSADKVDLPRLRIGGRGAGPADHFQGVLDDAVVYDRALSDADILAHAKTLGLAPVKARMPDPADGAVGVGMPLMKWLPGLDAQFHDVYLGTSEDLTEADQKATKQLFTMYYHVQGLDPGVTYYWRVDEIAADGVTVYAGDVWSFVTQDVKAYYPTPADKANNVGLAPTLTWMQGVGATEDQMFFGDSADAVAQGAADTDKGVVTETTFAPGDLEPLSTYFWRVDETIAGGDVQAGPVWSFTTTRPVDNFESYTDDEGGRIYETWIDGWTNGTGSTVGNLEAPFAEQTIVRTGLQSMPVDYNNANSPFYSEAELEFSPTEDWTANEIDTLILYVQGQMANRASPLYVSIEDSAGGTATVVHPDPAVVTKTTWTEWKLTLADFADVNMARVKKLTIGVGDKADPKPGSAGRIFIDDIQLAKPAPAGE